MDTAGFPVGILSHSGTWGLKGSPALGVENTCHSGVSGLEILPDGIPGRDWLC